MKIVRSVVRLGLLLLSTVPAAQEKPNILLIWGDDIGLLYPTYPRTHKN